MKLHKPLFIITFFITALCFAQRKTNKQHRVSIEEQIIEKIKEVNKLEQKHEYKTALAIVKQCIKKSHRIKNDSLLGIIYNINGIINSSLDKDDEAIRSYRKAEVAFMKIKNYEMIGDSYNNIAFSYQKNNKNLDSAIVYFKKTLEIYKYIERTDRMPEITLNLVEIYEKKNKLNEAETYLKEVIELAKSHKRKNILCVAYRYYARILYKRNNLKKALNYINLSEGIAIKDYKKDLGFIYELKSNIFEKMGDIKNSYIYLKKYDDYLERSHQIKKSELVQEASIKYEIKEHDALLEKTKLENTAKENTLNKSNQIIFFMTILFLIAAIASLLLYKNNRLKLENNKLLAVKNEELKELQHQTELNFLKTQIQPYFFFNTLTILYTLIIEKSKNAKEVVIKLSELMQYSIYEAKKETVSIWDEIGNIQNYLELESLYKNQKAFPAIQINGNLDNIRVPPLLCFSFIENCFKSQACKDKKVELSVSFNNLDDKYLLFSMKNNLHFSESEKEITDKFGIKKIKRRLNLIYKEDYSLITESIGTTYSVVLKIPI